MHLFTQFAPASDSRVPRRRSIRREGCGVTARVRACTRIKAFTATSSVVLAAGLLAVVAPAQAAPGELDTSFSEDGRQITDFGGGESGSAVAIQTDGKIVVAGRRDGDIALARYNPDGSLDTTFSVDGKQTTDLGGSDGALGVVIGPAGTIVAAGWSDSDLALARYNPDGSLDRTFSSDGTQTTDLGGSDGARGVVIQPDARIVAAGWTNSDFALARYNPDGSLDGSFAGDGTQTTEIVESSGAAGLAMQRDGKLVAVGRTGSDLALTRYATDGSLDATFSGDGKQSTDFGGDEDGAAVALQADGRIVAAGTSIRPDSGGYNGDFALARYHPDGSLDTSFANGGKQTTEFNWDETARALAIQADGSIVVAGGQTYPAYPENGGAFALASYYPGGSLEGTQVTVFLGDVEFGAYARAEGVAVQADGKFVAVGSAASASFSSDFALARYDGGSASGTAPTNSSPPTISGTATESQTLTVNSGAWTGSTPINRTVQWRRCASAGTNCVDIAAATATTYALGAADVGHTIRARETATNPYGQSSVDSAATAVVKAKPGTIAGIVRNQKNGATIANANVNCGSGYSTKTASDGRYSIPNVATGTHSCTASANRYGSSMQTVTVNPGQTATANFGLVRQ